jgi:hypothetical protein
MASKEFPITPFMVPNFVSIQMPPGLRQDGFKPNPSIPLSDLDMFTLGKLCDEFRAAVFAKAGKQDYK